MLHRVKGTSSVATAKTGRSVERVIDFLGPPRPLSRQIDLGWRFIQVLEWAGPGLERPGADEPAAAPGISPVTDRALSAARRG
jgi:hypothetical protein